MPSQNDFRIMQLLLPVWAITKKPNDEALVVYCEKLSKYPAETIRLAVTKICDKWDRGTPPLPAIFVSTCEQVGRPQTTSTASGLPWVERDEKRAKMIKDFRDKFLKSPFYNRAVYERWDSELYRYTMAIAWVQVQMIIPDLTNAIGYEGYLVLHNQSWGDFYAEQKRICSAGEINVQVTDTFMEKWKAKVNMERIIMEEKQKAIA